MLDLDALTPNFSRAVDRWPGAPTLTSQLESLRVAYNAGDHGLIGVARSYVECVARTIIGEFSSEIPDAASTTVLINRAMDCLGFRNTRASSPLNAVLSAHNRLADALSEMRNHHDPNSHGKDGFLDALTNNEMRAFLLTADTLTALLLAAHDGSEPNLSYTREPYDRFGHLHEKIDGRIYFESVVEAWDGAPTLVVSIQTEPRTAQDASALELRIELSRLLYHLDRDAYIEVLDAADRLPPPSPDVDLVDDREETATPSKTEPELRLPLVVSKPDHGTELAVVSAEFAQQVESLGLTEVAADLSSELLAAAAGSLALDWRSRTVISTAMKVAMRRVLVRHEVDPARAEQSAGDLLAWLIRNVPERQDAS